MECAKTGGVLGVVRMIFLFIAVTLDVTLETFASGLSCTFENKSVSELCYSIENAKCLMNNSVTENSDLKGCFWNPKYAYFSCVVSGNASFFWHEECKESCPKVCSENYWKCNDLCIAVNQPCNGECMPYYTFECNGTCIPVNKPCESLCYKNYNQINCNGQCLDTRYEKEKIIQSGCEGEIQSSIKFSLIEMLKPSCMSSMSGSVNSFNYC